MSARSWGIGAALAVLALSPAVAPAQQVPDTAYGPTLGMPTFAPGAGPRVAIDGAHRNFHTLRGGYRPFADLLRRDGYRVASNDVPFTPMSLQAVDVLVIANALHEQSADAWSPLPTLSAFTDDEVAAVERWVAGGGALLLIADHMPLAGHAESLAAAFGLRFQNGFAMEATGGGHL